MERLSAFEQRLYSPQKIAAVVCELAEQGVATPAALDGTGLDAPQLKAPETRISYRQLDAVFRNALRLTRDPAIALRAGQRMRITSHGIYGYALLSSASYADAIDFSTRYAPVMGPLVQTTYSRDGATMACECEPRYWPDPTQDLYRFVVEFALSMHQTAALDMAGRSFRFKSVDLAYAPPRHERAYRNLFKCPVRFGRGGNRLLFDAAWLDRPFTLADPVSNAGARQLCEKLLAEVRDGSGLAGDIRHALLEQPGRFPGVEAMARRFGLHPRALRRRLEAEQTSYRSLLTEVRMRLAIEYLRHTPMTNEDIATRLGYSDAANFRHALARWSGGKRPSDYRAG